MVAIKTTGTLTAGNSRTFDLAPGSALTLTLLPNCRVTVTETPETVSASDAGGNSPRTHNHQLAGVVTYGPYAMGGSVVVDNASNSGSTVTWRRKDTVVTMNEDSTSLVSPDGTILGPQTVTYAQALAALATMPIGSNWRISDLGGSYWEKSATGILRPLNSIAITHDIAAPVTFAAGVSPRIYAEYLLPAGALQNGFYFQLEPLFSKSGVTDSMAMNIALSATAGSVGTSISLSGAIAILAAANRRGKGRYRFQRLSATTIGNEITNIQGEGALSGAAYAAVTVPTMASAVYLQVVGTASGSTDTMQLESCPLTIIGNPNL